MAIQRALLLIADIGGYTRFMKVHRLNLAHAQDTVAQLLEAVIDGAAPFRLSKLEGDAAFFYATLSGSRLPALRETVSAIRRSFMRRRERMVLDRMCSCEGCMQIEKLNLKFVAHAGEVAFQRVKRHTELAGMDVILLHRMLKNDVPVPEYVLTTDDGLEGLDADFRKLATPLDHDFEGIGPTRTHYVDLGAVPEPPVEVPRPSPVGKLWAKVRFEARALPYLLGIKASCEGFKNLDPKKAPPTEPVG